MIETVSVSVCDSESVPVAVIMFDPNDNGTHIAVHASEPSPHVPSSAVAATPFTSTPVPVKAESVTSVPMIVIVSDVVDCDSVRIVTIGLSYVGVSPSVIG